MDKPEFKVQKQYERLFKRKFASMLLNMNKTIILKLSSFYDSKRKSNTRNT